MKLVGRAALLCCAGILLVVAIPFGLVQLDLMPAAWLRMTPTAIALTIAVTLIAVALGRKPRDPARNDPTTGDKP